MSVQAELLEAARRFLEANPGEIGRIVRGLLGMRLGVPLDALRWVARQVEATGKIRDVELRAVPPGIAFAATANVMKTMVRAAAEVYIQRVKVDSSEIRIEIRVENVSLSLPEPSDTAVALLIQSGALDLSQPGTVLKRLPGVPPVVVDSYGDMIVLDLLRLPQMQHNPALREKLELVTALLTVHAIETDEAHLDVNFRLIPQGLRHAATTVNRLLLRPSLAHARSKVFLLLPGARAPAS